MHYCPNGLALALVVISLSSTFADTKPVEIIAHRGASFDAPENTLAAINLAWKQSADAVEFDVYLSKDGQIFLFHDKDTKRTAGGNQLIAEMTLEELRQLDVGRWKGEQFTGEKVPTLAEALDTVPENKRVFIEVKSGPEIVPELDRVITQANLKPAQTAIISFSKDVVTAVKKALPELEAYWIVSLKEKNGESKWTAEGLIRRAKQIRADGLDLSAHPMITAAFVDQLRAAKLPVYVWTVNELPMARDMIETGVIGITTDRPGWLRAQLDEEINEADVRVMSFNIRYGTAQDGENRWDKRRDFVVDTITAFDPDLLGTQETLSFQRDYLTEQLPGYEAFGVGREDGKDKGEQTTLFYKKDRFEKLDGGHFWLSQTPDQPGSKSWDSSLPRMVSWVKLRDRRQPNEKPVIFFNTHFDHRGEKARAESAKLIRRKVNELGKDCAVVVTGDFNCAEGSEPYQALFGKMKGTSAPVVDAYRVANPDRAENEGTYSGFRATNTGGARIDWIACSPDWRVIRATIDRTGRNGRTASDHFPVTAILRR